MYLTNLRVLVFWPAENGMHKNGFALELFSPLVYSMHELREEPSQINTILQQKLPAVILSTVYTVYKQ